MINESLEKEFARYSLRLKKDRAYNSSETQTLDIPYSVWITAIIISLLIFTLGIIIGASITSKSALYPQKNSFLTKHCEFVQW